MNLICVQSIIFCVCLPSSLIESTQTETQHETSPQKTTTQAESEFILLTVDCGLIAWVVLITFHISITSSL